MIFRYKNLPQIQKIATNSVIQLSLHNETSFRDLKVIDLNKDEDLTFSINTLKTLFIRDNKTSAYLAYEKLESFRRSAEMSTIDYLNAFQRLYFKDYISCLFQNGNLSIHFRSDLGWDDGESAKRLPPSFLQYFMTFSFNSLPKQL